MEGISSIIEQVILALLDAALIVSGEHSSNYPYLRSQTNFTSKFICLPVNSGRTDMFAKWPIVAERASHGTMSTAGLYSPNCGAATPFGFPTPTF